MSTPKLYRVILPTGDIKTATRFYTTLLDMPGRRVSAGKHYFDCGGIILACYDPLADGDTVTFIPMIEPLFFAVSDLEATYRRAKTAGCTELDSRLDVMPGGERCFYATDPFGNRLCFVDEKTALMSI